MKSNSNTNNYRAGGIAPDFKLATVHGSYLSLSDILEQRCAVLLVFLRHLG